MSRRSISLIAFALVLPACGDGNSGGIVVSGPPPDRVVVTPALASITEGDSIQLSVQVLDAGGDPVVGATVIWSSDEPTIASVNATGLVRGESPGGAGITATGVSAGVEVAGTARVTVVAAGPS